MPDEASDVVDVYTEEFFDVCSDVSSQASSVNLGKVSVSVGRSADHCTPCARFAPDPQGHDTSNTRVHGGVQ